jgi:hypothetical protein
MVSKPTNAHKHMKLYYTHRMPATCDHLKGGALQDRYIRIVWKFQNQNRYKILNFKNNTC